MIFHMDALGGDITFTTYRQTSNISRPESQKWSVSPLVFAQFVKARCEVENEDVVGATPSEIAPTTSEWSKILLP